MGWDAGCMGRLGAGAFSAQVCPGWWGTPNAVHWHQTNQQVGGKSVLNGEYATEVHEPVSCPRRPCPTSHTMVVGVGVFAEGIAVNCGGGGGYWLTPCCVRAVFLPQGRAAIVQGVRPSRRYCLQVGGWGMKEPHQTRIHSVIMDRINAAN